MPKLTALISLLFFFYISHAQQPVIDTSTGPAITAIGEPDGPKKEIKIGKEGGSLFSEDRKIELKFPPDAFTKKTTVSIQAITNFAPNSSGKAYRFEPSGVTFSKPVRLIFHYGNENIADSMRLLTGIATQDKKGQWYQLKKTEIDTVEKTISGIIPHFSDWTTFEFLSLLPKKARVKVNKSTQLEVHYMNPDPLPKDDELESLVDDLLAPLVKPKYFSIKEWAVNGVVGGNSSVGQIKSVGMLDASYKAPSLVPDANPVEVSAKLKDLDFTYKGVKFKDLKLVSHITVYDNAYEIKIVTRLKGSAGSRLGMVTYKDEGSLLVLLQQGKAKVLDIRNENETLQYVGSCNVQVTNPATCYGLVIIAGISGIKVTPGEPYPTVDIAFIQVPAALSKLYITCPDTPPASISPNSILGMLPAYPQYVKFIANDKEQIIQQFGEENGELFVKISVKKVGD